MAHRQIAARRSREDAADVFGNLIVTVLIGILIGILIGQQLVRLGLHP